MQSVRKINGKGKNLACFTLSHLVMFEKNVVCFVGDTVFDSVDAATLRRKTEKHSVSVRFIWTSDSVTNGISKTWFSSCTSDIPPCGTCLDFNIV